MLDLKRLTVFREVVHRRSFSAAAAALNYSQPAVSHHVARLELELGVQLLLRTRSGVELTPAGRALLQHADDLLARSEVAEAHVVGLRDGMQAQVRVVAFATASATIVADAIAALRTSGAGIGVQLAEGDPGDALASLRMRQVDVAVVFDDERHPTAFPPELRAELLLDDPMLLTLPREHPCADLPRVPLGGLRDEEWIQGAGEETPASLILVAACQDAGFEPRVAFNTGNFGVVQELVAHGIGIALVPALALARPHPGVVARALDPSTPVRRIWALHREPASEDGAIVTVLEALRRAAAGRRQALEAAASEDGR